MPVTARHAAAIERLKREHAGRRVLLVEDNPINCAIAAELLRQSGLLVQTVADGRGAVAAACDGRFDIVLMDVRMPVMDGLEATRALRAAGVATPIVAMTADAEVGDRSACRAAGMNDLVAKPIEPNALYEALLAWLPATPAGDDTALLEQLAAVDGLDPEVALASVGGDAQALVRVLSRFAETYQGGAPELAAGGTSEQRRVRRRTVHTLRGVAATLGAVTLQDALEAYERADDAGLGAADLDALADGAQSELRGLVAALGPALRRASA